MLRRRFPFPAFLLTVPELILTAAHIATLVALYSMARFTNKPVLLAAATVVTFAGFTTVWEPPYIASALLLSSIHGVVFAFAPVALGLLVRTRQELSTRISEIERAHEHERELTAQLALALERARLAREMHDVVSHQVSLIACRLARFNGQPGPERQGSGAHHP